ncbi:NAD(P)H nitroreductase [Mycobacteroides franklinii]|uniref:NAD(P)H nitroreductase n=1 Tax=Mycobacteroides franklinii TaxID=948102 RepID=A0A4R5P9M1_9MYCO|nr:NAD(P)H nitroreductase [Mycobacteroides franklinii]ORA60057.1 NAD(P)H nitroreductase [Mycobacteroides franklinii]TDH20194.1 NAD(P)H nitroreductase [Mycobacteroides franklinii]
MAVTHVVLARDVVVKAIQAACRAPSIHNSQPWRWVMDDEVKLYLDVNRVLRVDPSRREALISCGAVLDHFRAAAAAFGWLVQPEYFPNPNDLTHLATMNFTKMQYVTDAHRDRLHALERRYTDRLPFLPPPRWAVTEQLLRQAVSDRAFLDVLADEARPCVVEAAQLSEGLRQYDPEYKSEIDWWTAPFKLSEGIPSSSLPSEEERNRVDIGRGFPFARHQERRATVPQDRATLAVLSTADDSAQDFLRCGEALSALLIEATVAGLATCTLTHVIELAASRQIIEGLTDRDYPQAVVRIGATPPLEPIPAPTPRRPLSAVLEFTGR